MARVVNPLLKVLLRSPLHWLLGGHLALLAFTGRKTGFSYTVVVGLHEVGGRFVVVTGTTGRKWRFNFRGGMPLVVTIHGRRRYGRGYLLEDPEEVVCVHELLLERVGMKNGRRLGLRVNVDRKPTNDELKAVLAGRG